jgi:hypothetical protein
MLGALFVSLAIAAGAQQPAQPIVALPDTPQGKHVAAYIAAFNSGDIKKYLAFYEEHMAASILAKRSVEDRTAMFTKMRATFSKLTPSKVVKASAQQILVLFPTADGDAQGTFTFDFEAAEPYKIAGLGVELDMGR